jgi:hypothetical protein
VFAASEADERAPLCQELNKKRFNLKHEKQQPSNAPVLFFLSFFSQLALRGIICLVYFERVLRPIISLVRFERVHMSNPLRDATKKKAPKTESGAEASVEMDIPRLIGVKCRESGGEARDAFTPVMSRSSFSLPRKVRQRG